MFEGLEDRLTDPQERAVAAFVSERADEVLEFARELIRTPSVNPPGDESVVATVLVERLAALGVTDHRIVAASADRPNVLAHVDGNEPGVTMMLSGHIDTKPPGDLDSWNTDPHDPVIEDGRLYGLGSGDMKVAIAAMVYAAAALRHVGEFPGRLALALTADEENGSVAGSKWLAEEGLVDADVCVIGEPGGVAEEWESIHLISRGAALFRVVVYGTQLHSSISDQLPTVNATLKMAELALRMQRELRDHLTFEDHPYCRYGPTVNIGMTASSGVTYGVFPGRAEFASDIRTIPGMTEAQIRADVQGFVDQAMADDPELRAEIVWDAVVPATEIDAAHPVVGALQSVADVVLGHTPRLDAFPGATDAAYLQTGAGVPCIASFGPGLLPRAHSPNEWLFADGAAKATMVYALAALRYLRASA
ncbi:MAG TPA: M20 family metallopeptidase [Ilumatobacteraceae bacterium]|nr:M20 family metallopeptidase [Ilumatobacteraceae bacterium]